MPLSTNLNQLQAGTTPMGIGRVGNSSIIIKRNFRFIFEIETPYGTVPKHYVQTAGRPSLELEEVEVSFLNQTTWFPGRAKWQPITVTYLDTTDQEMKPFYDWMVSLYNYQSNSYTQTEKIGWDSTGLLTMVDGCGKALERWEYGNMWPTSINFGEIGAQNNELSKIEVTFRYSDVRHLTNGCSPIGQAQCFGCDNELISAG